MIEHSTEERIRALAKPLWESAARPYGVAMDFWLMAEKMVLELVSTATQLQKTAAGEGDIPEHRMWPPEAVPVARIQHLAECMWESAGRQYGAAQDFWLAAERHVLAMVRAATGAPVSPEYEKMVADFANLPPEAYLNRIRLMAYYLWESAGRRYGSALDYWLEAERMLLNLMGNVSAQGSLPGEPPSAQMPSALVPPAQLPAASEAKATPRRRRTAATRTSQAVAKKPLKP